MSLRDVFTDLAAAPDNFEADELPPDTKVSSCFLFFVVLNFIIFINVKLPGVATD